MSDPILIKIKSGDDFIALTTVDRKHGRNGRFLIDAEKFAHWAEGGVGTFYDKDCGDYLSAFGDSAEVTWLSSYGDDSVRGFVQRFNLPTELLRNPWNEINMRYVSYDRSRKSPIVVSPGAHALIAKICKNKRRRRALSKAIRDNFNYGTEHPVELIRGYGEFEFRHCGMYGGLIEHTGNIVGKDGKSYISDYFSVHT